MPVMTNVPLGPGGWHYDKGHRICVNGLGGKATKTVLQATFGEFGHIIKIETPRSGSAAYVSFKDRGDAEDAIKSMDGESVEGQRITVTKAGERPPPNLASRRVGDAPQSKSLDIELELAHRSRPRKHSHATPRSKESADVLTTMNFEREERRTAQYLDSNGQDKRIYKSRARSRSRGEGLGAGGTASVSCRDEERGGRDRPRRPSRSANGSRGNRAALPRNRRAATSSGSEEESRSPSRSRRRRR